MAEANSIQAQPATIDRILDRSELAVRTRGFNGFSYADIANELGLSKTSIHHYFPTKAELGLALIKRFTTNVMMALVDIEQKSNDSSQMLEAYLKVYLASLHENKMCLCGMLAAEHETLVPAMQDGINDFFAGHIAWLEKILRAGLRDRKLHFTGRPVEHARLILTTMQGGLLLAKSQRSIAALESIAENLLITYRGPGGSEAQEAAECD